jgi:hypothetical protein
MKENEMGRACSMYRRERSVYIIFVGKTREEMLRRPRCRWENNVRVDLTEYVGKVWTGFIWLRIGTSGGLL